MTEARIRRLVIEDGIQTEEYSVDSYEVSQGSGKWDPSVDRRIPK